MTWSGNGEDEKSDTNDNTFVSELLTPTPGIWSANGSEEYLKSETTGCLVCLHTGILQSTIRC